MSVLTNLSLFQIVNFQNFYYESVTINRMASQVPITFLKKVNYFFKKSLITNISEVTDIRMKSSQVQLPWKKIEQILSTIIMNMWLLGEYQCTLCEVISCHSLATCPVCAQIHSFHELDKSTPRISRTSQVHIVIHKLFSHVRCYQSSLLLLGSR